MKPKIIKPIKTLTGTVNVPGDKSISHRAVMLGAIANGRTKIRGFLDCDDCDFTVRAFRDMGIGIRRSRDAVIVSGNGLKGLKAPAGPLYVGNSGTTMRLLAGILAGQDFESTLESDVSLSNRPMKRIVEPLSMMGAEISARKGDYPPLRIRGGRLNPIDYELPVPSAQVKSAVLLAGLYANGFTSVAEKFKSRDHTERMLKNFGAKVKIEDLRISVEGGRQLKPSEVKVPGDISSAAFLIAGATLLKGSKVKIDNVSINPTRAGILDVLSRMGARVRISNRKSGFEPYADIEVRSGRTRGIIIEEGSIPAVIDELPVIFVLASLSEGRTVIKGAGELKVKETDRIRSMRENLVRMGARIEVAEGDIVIDGVAILKGGAELKSFGDHRTCMAMTIAALGADEESSIDDVECVNKSFPEFFKILKKLENKKRK